MEGGGFGASGSFESEAIASIGVLFSTLSTAQTIAAIINAVTTGKNTRNGTVTRTNRFFYNFANPLLSYNRQAKNPATRKNNGIRKRWLKLKKTSIQPE